MKRTAVVYWSQTGNTEAMAQAVAASARADLIAAADFAAVKIAEYDAIAFGCPSMGAEVLEEDTFEPMFADCLPHLKAFPLALFGSYGWGDGEWMRAWERRCLDAGAVLVAAPVLCQETPDAAALAACSRLGQKLAAT